MGKKPTSKKMLGAIYDKTSGHCAYCGKELEPYGDWHTDHIQPKSKGGQDHIDNYYPSCPQCNRMKHNNNMDNWRYGLEVKMYHPIYSILEDLAKYKMFIGNSKEYIEDAKKTLMEAHNKLAEIEIRFYVDGNTNE